MKTTSLLTLARRRNMTLGRAAVEIMSAAGEIPRQYPTAICAQPIPLPLLRQARWYHGRQWPCLVGPRGYLP